MSKQSTLTAKSFNVPNPAIRGIAKKMSLEQIDSFISGEHGQIPDRAISILQEQRERLIDASLLEGTGIDEQDIDEEARKPLSADEVSIAKAPENSSAPATTAAVAVKKSGTWAAYVGDKFSGVVTYLCPNPNFVTVVVRIPKNGGYVTFRGVASVPAAALYRVRRVGFYVNVTFSETVGRFLLSI